VADHHTAVDHLQDLTRQDHLRVPHHPDHPQDLHQTMAVAVAELQEEDSLNQ
jgi:hypothetical protein